MGMIDEELFLACRSADPARVEKALNLGAGANALIADGSTPLHALARAAQGNDPGRVCECQTLLLSFGADPRLKDDSRKVAGHYFANEAFRKANLFKALEMHGDVKLLSMIKLAGRPVAELAR